MDRCPDANLIVDFVHGALVERDERTVTDHVAGCSACHAVVAELARGLPVPSGDEGPPGEPIAVGTHVGRYVIERWLGAGGMGVVYRAYDPELDRRVALKLWTPERSRVTSPEQRMDRQLREARAMARISHPNVLPIFEVGTFDGQGFLIMELVDGWTLRRWQALEGRSWRAIVGTYVQAGHGLAAAHRANIVHRDFKPENVLVRRDGRVYVTDFGLARQGLQTARGGDEALDEAAGATSVEAARDPSTGAAGTPAFMAPERWRGIATARGDQYAFCVALEEAVGTSTVPARVRAALLRGRDPDPARRFPTMEALLEQLTVAPPATRWRRAAWALFPLVATSLLTTFTLRARTTTAEPPCSGTERRLAGIWDGERRQAVRAAFRGTELHLADATSEQVTRSLDGYASAWAQASEETCASTVVRREQSNEVMELRNACLDRRLDELRATTEAFTRATPSTVENAIAAVQSLGRVDACADVAALHERFPLPGSPERRAALQALSRRLDDARLLERTGQFDDALAAAEGVEKAARSAQYPPLLAEALLTLGRLDFHRFDYERSASRLHEAVRTAEIAHDPTVRAAAWTLTAQSLGFGLRRYDDALRAADLGEATLDGAGLGGELRAGLAMARSGVAHRRGDYAESLARAREALELRAAALDADDFRLADTWWAIAMNHEALRQHEATLDALDHARAIHETTIGPDHWKMAMLLGTISSAYTNLGRHQEAIAAARRSLEVHERRVPRQAKLVAYAELRLGSALDAADRFEGAERPLRRAGALYEKKEGTAGALLALGRALRHRGRFVEAIELYRQSAEMFRDHPLEARALYGVGACHLGSNQAARAIAPLERALAIETRATGNRVDRAAMQFDLARALWLTKRERARAGELAKTAREGFADSPQHAKEREEVATWLAARHL